MPSAAAFLHRIIPGYTASHQLAFYKTTIETSCSSSEVRQRLTAIVGPERSVWESPFGRDADPERRPFEGKLSDTSFRIQRDIGYRNSFLPIIRGRIDKGDAGTRIPLRMTVHPLVGAFGVVWVLGVGAFVIATGSPLAVAMLAFGVLIGAVPFYAEALAASRALQRELGVC